MTLGQLLILILIAILAYFLLKIGLIILIIVIILIVLYFLFTNFKITERPINKHVYEGYKKSPKNYSNDGQGMNIFPEQKNLGNMTGGLISISSISNPAESTKWTLPLPQSKAQEQYPRISRMTSSGHDNYWYIPIQEYYDEKQNNIIPKYNLPESTSEYCVNKHIQESDDLGFAISKCTVPAKLS